MAVNTRAWPCHNCTKGGTQHCSMYCFGLNHVCGAGTKCVCGWRASCRQHCSKVLLLEWLGVQEICSGSMAPGHLLLADEKQHPAGPPATNPTSPNRNTCAAPHSGHNTHRQRTDGTVPGCVAAGRLQSPYMWHLLLSSVTKGLVGCRQVCQHPSVSTQRLRY